MPPSSEPIDPGYVAARRVLLDALQALAPHGPAVIVAGAQAVYLHTGDSELAVAPYTTDGDLAIDPTLLEDEPRLEAAMRAAGFDLDLSEPGIWLQRAVVRGEEVRHPGRLDSPRGRRDGWWPSSGAHTSSQ
jgi:hypothetical protein